MKPGEDLVTKGIDDLNAGHETVESLLVSTAASRLRQTGLAIPNIVIDEPSHRLYRLLSLEDPSAAHSRYNALIRRLISYARAAECGI